MSVNSDGIRIRNTKFKRKATSMLLACSMLLGSLSPMQSISYADTANNGDIPVEVTFRDDDKGDRITISYKINGGPEVTAPGTFTATGASQKETVIIKDSEKKAKFVQGTNNKIEFFAKDQHDAKSSASVLTGIKYDSVIPNKPIVTFIPGVTGTLVELKNLKDDTSGVKELKALNTKGETLTSLELNNNKTEIDKYPTYLYLSHDKIIDKGAVELYINDYAGNELKFDTEFNDRKIKAAGDSGITITKDGVPDLKTGVHRVNTTDVKVPMKFKLGETFNVNNDTNKVNLVVETTVNGTKKQYVTNIPVGSFQYKDAVANSATTKYISSMLAGTITEEYVNGMKVNQDRPATGTMTDEYEINLFDLLKTNPNLVNDLKTIPDGQEITFKFSTASYTDNLIMNGTETPYKLVKDETAPKGLKTITAKSNDQKKEGKGTEIIFDATFEDDIMISSGVNDIYNVKMKVEDVESNKVIANIDEKLEKIGSTGGLTGTYKIPSPENYKNKAGVKLKVTTTVTDSAGNISTPKIDTLIVDEEAPKHKSAKVDYSKLTKANGKMKVFVDIETPTDNITKKEDITFSVYKKENEKQTPIKLSANGTFDSKGNITVNREIPIAPNEKFDLKLWLSDEQNNSRETIIDNATNMVMTDTDFKESTSKLQVTDISNIQAHIKADLGAVTNLTGYGVVVSETSVATTKTMEEILKDANTKKVRLDNKGEALINGLKEKTNYTSYLTVIDKSDNSFNIIQEIGTGKEIGKTIKVDFTTKQESDVKPIIKVEPYPTEWTNKDVKVKATTGFGKLENSELTFTKNEIQKFVHSSPITGKTEESVDIKHIDKVKPTTPTPTVTFDTQQATKNHSIIKINPTDTLSGIADNGVKWEMNGDKTGAWENAKEKRIDWSKGNSPISVKYLAKDKAGNEQISAELKSHTPSHYPIQTEVIDWNSTSVKVKVTPNTKNQSKGQYEIIFKDKSNPTEKATSGWTDKEDITITGLKPNKKYVAYVNAKNDSGYETGEVALSKDTEPKIIIPGGLEDLDTSPTATDIGLKIQMSETKWTNKDVTATATTKRGTLNKSSHTFTSNGEFTFTVTTPIGDTVSEVVKVGNIDKVKPTIKVTPTVTKVTPNDFDIKVEIADDLSGLNKLVLPDGTEVKNPTAVYNHKVTKNGVYKFRVYDNTETNFSEETIEIKNIDKVPPKVTIEDYNKSWTNGDITVKATTTKGTLNKTEHTFTSNGEFTFKATAENGLIDSIVISVTNIDKDKPIVNHTLSNTNPTNNDLDIKLSTSDAISGIKSIINPDGTTATGENPIYKVVQNGTYKFVVTDNASNVTEHIVEVTSIDKVPPKITIEPFDKKWTANDIIVKAKTDKGTLNVTEHKFTENGTFKFVATTPHGNVTEEIVTVGNIDKTKPEFELEYDKVKTNKDIEVTVKVTNPLSGLKEVRLPDGTKSTTNNTKFIMTENGKYKFEVESNSGLITEKEIDLKLINKIPPVITISGTPTNWTDKDVVVTATTTSPEATFTSAETPSSTEVKTFTSNGEYTFVLEDVYGNRVEETVKIDKIDKEETTILINFPKDKTNKDVTATVNITPTPSGVKEIELPDGTKTTEPNTSFVIDKDGEYTVKVTSNSGKVTTETITVDKMINKVKPIVDVTGNPTDWTDQDVKLIATTDKGTLDKTELVVSENGTFKFTATDEYGNIGEKEVTVDKIDKVNPKLEFTYPTKPTNKDIKVKVVVTVGPSGVKEIKLPDGNTTTDSEFEYLVTENGDFKFTLETNQGKTFEETVSITNIDKTLANIVVEGIPTEWTNKDVTVTATVDKGTLNTDSHTFTENGTFEFIATDSFGVEVVETVTVDKIDKTEPKVEFEFDPAPTNKDKEITIKVTTGPSGIKEITLPDGTKSTDSTIVIVADKDNLGKIIVEDKAGNIVEKEITDIGVDKILPVITIKPYIKEPTGKDIEVKATIDKGTLDKDSHIFTENGEFEFVGRDKYGNVVKEKVVITNIDKTKPTVAITKTPSESITDEDVVIKVEVTHDKDVTIKFPDGTEVKGKEGELTVTDNGTYEIVVEDNIGNIVKEVVTIDNINKDPNKTPVRLIIEDGEYADAGTWARGRQIKLRVVGNFKHVELPMSAKSYDREFSYIIKNNGEHTFKALGKDGVSEDIKTLTITNIDNDIPEISFEKSMTEANAVIVNATDKTSGIKHLIDPAGNVIEGSDLPVTLTTNQYGAYKAIDKAGNEAVRTYTREDVNIGDDATSETLIRVSGKPDRWTNQDVTITVDALNETDGIEDIILEVRLLAEGESIDELDLKPIPNEELKDDFDFKTDEEISEMGIMERAGYELSIVGHKAKETIVGVASAVSGVITDAIESGKETIENILGIDKVDADDSIRKEMQDMMKNNKLGITSPMMDNLDIVDDISIDTDNKVLDNNDDGIQPVADIVEGDLVIPLAGTSYDGKMLSKSADVHKNGRVLYTVQNAKGTYHNIVPITEIDKVLPEITYTMKGNEMKYKVTDDLSGIKRVELPNGVIQESPIDEVLELSGVVTFNAEGEFNFTVVDYADNEKTITVEFGKDTEPDKPAPKPDPIKPDPKPDGGNTGGNTNGNNSGSTEWDDFGKYGGGGGGGSSSVVTVSDQQTYEVQYKTSNRMLSKEVGKATIGSELTLKAKDISGFKLVDKETKTLKVSKDVTKNIVIFNYESVENTAVQRHKPYIFGFTDGTVRPDDTITREQVASIFNRTGYFKPYNQTRLSDVRGRWSTLDITTMENLGVLSGYPDGTFKPTKEITWAELFSIVARFNNLQPNGQVNTKSINGHWSEEYAKLVIGNHFVSDFRLTEENLNKKVTRAEFISVMNKILERTPNKEDIIDAQNNYSDLKKDHKYYTDIMEATIEHKFIKQIDKNEVWVK